MNRRVDLNCDVGEGCGADEELCALVTSVNVACGGHAGDRTTMERTVDLALRNGTAIGAHPGYLDREGFGRKELSVAAALLDEQLAEQVRALEAIAASRGTHLSHVKLHGALYSLAARDPQTARLVLRAIAAATRCRTIYALAGSAFVRIARDAGFVVAEEAFADRAYRADGSLAPRGSPGALIADPAAAAARGVRMVREGAIEAVDGSLVAARADTICIHGDEPSAAACARALRQAFLGAGIDVKRFGAP